MQVFSQRWSQTRPRIAGSGLSRRVMRTASANSPGAHGRHVAGHLLVDRALVQAGRRDAVEGAQDARRLGPVRPERVLPVAPVAADRVGVAAQVECGARRDVGAVAAEPAGREAARGRRPPDEVGGVDRADGVERGVDLLRILEQAQVAARLQQVGADGDGAQAGAAAGRPR